MNYKLSICVKTPVGKYYMKEDEKKTYTQAEIDVVLEQFAELASTGTYLTFESDNGVTVVLGEGILKNSSFEVYKYRD